MKSIPFFDYSALFQENSQELIKIFKSVSSRGAFIMQDDLVQFEENLAKYTNVK